MLLPYMPVRRKGHDDDDDREHYGEQNRDKGI